MPRRKNALKTISPKGIEFHEDDSPGYVSSLKF